MIVRRLYNVALAKSLREALKRGNVDIIRNILKKGIDTSYQDDKGRNFIMCTMKYNSEKRLEIIIMLIEAGCDINHVDKNGWTCLQYACACGAIGVVEELIQRGANVCYNQLGYGPEELCIPKTQKPNSLLQHTEQVVQEGNIKRSWEIFKNAAESQGYRLTCPEVINLGVPIKIAFQAPESHSIRDRIRIVNLQSDNAIWMQNDHMIEVPPGGIGTITLDNEMISLPSTYRCIYERYNDKENVVDQEDKNKSTRDTNDEQVEMEPSIEETQTSTTTTTTTTTTITTTASPDKPSTGNPEPNVVKNTSNQGKRSIVAMCDMIVRVDLRSIADTNEYEITISSPGTIGLTLEPHHEGSKQTNKVIVKSSCGQSTNVQPGDLLIAIGGNNVEHSGFKHTVWELNEAHQRPLILRFRRGNSVLRKASLLPFRRNSTLKKTSAADV